MNAIPPTPPNVLSIAGSDPSGGAGIQADLKSFSAVGAYGMCVVTALTAQNTRGVTAVHQVPVDMVRAQIHTLADDVRIDAVKIGMLASSPLIGVVDEALRGPLAGIPLVVDPVMVATSGDRLLDEEAVDRLRQLCLRADVVTPNLAEAAVLAHGPVAVDVPAMRAQADALLDWGMQRVLLKGGHLGGQAVDVWRDRAEVVELSAPRVDTANTHGTGCSLSSALAALRPQRTTWLEAARDAKTWLSGAIDAAHRLRVGRGHGPVHHFHAWW